MINRYKNKRILKNDLNEYSNIFENRNVQFIEHYETPKFSKISFEDYANIKTITYVWKEGDRFYKLAEKYYGDAKDWWVIAKFNLKPTESHVKVGDIIEIPTPVETVLQYMTD